jgi:hypothetical protein
MLIRKSIPLLFGLAGVVAAAPSAWADEARGLTAAEFERLHQQLRPPADEGWREVPWKLSVLEARDQAAREKKPVFMLVRSGHPLGCV